MERRQLSEESLDVDHVRDVARRLGGHDFKCWFYGDSIGFEGLLAAAELTSERQWVEFAHGFFRAWAARRRPFQLDDNTAPGMVMCKLAVQRDDQLLADAVLDLGRHLAERRRAAGVSITFEDTLRSLVPPYGGLNLSAEDEELMRDPGPGIYLDCMHFDPPFFAALDQMAPGEGWAELATSELLAYRPLLIDEGTGLYNHFWLERTAQSYTRGWGRGQGWALLGLIDVAVQLDPDTAGINDVRDETLRLARIMLGYQLEDGNWHALVHEPRSGPESSTAAFMATAFYRGMAAGLLPATEFQEPANRAFNAFVRNLDSQGNLTGVSAAVYSALVEEHYWHVPLDRIVPWGQGPVLTALSARNAFMLGRAQ